MDQQKLRTVITGIAAVAITLCVGLVVSKQETWETIRFWAFLGPLLFSEILVTASFTRLHGASKAKSFPVMLGFVIIPLCYCFFTLLMPLLLWTSGFSANGILIFQVIVLFAVLLAVFLFQMAEDSVLQQAVETAGVNASRRTYRVMVDTALVTLRERFAVDRNLRKQLDQLYDAARYAADSVPGMEKIEIENELESQLFVLMSSADTIGPEELSSSIASVLSSFRKREAMIKSLR